jgi:hypothetical protein
MALIQAVLPDYVDFPGHMIDGRFKWMPANAPLTPLADVATDIYKEKVLGAADVGVNYDKRAEKLIIQNNSIYPLKVCVVDGNDACEVNKFHFVLVASVVQDDGTGGTYIFYPRLENVKRISVISVGGAGRISMTKIPCVKDL